MKQFTPCGWVPKACWDVALEETSTCWFFFCCGLFLLKQITYNIQKKFTFVNFTLSKKTNSMVEHLSHVCGKSNKKRQWIIHSGPIYVLWAGIHKIKAADGIPKFNLLFDLSLCYCSEMQILNVYLTLLENIRPCFEQVYHVIWCWVINPENENYNPSRGTLLRLREICPQPILCVSGVAFHVV